MAERTSISWTDHTFNGWIGCQHYGPGCLHCYAEALVTHWRKVEWGPNGPRIKTTEENWREPLKWNRQAEADGRRHRVFTASLSDVFEDRKGDVIDHNGKRLSRPRYGYHETIVESAGWDFSGCKPLRLDDLRDRLFDNLIDLTPWLDWQVLTKRAENIRRMVPGVLGGSRYRFNAWFGTSIACQADANRNLPHLQECGDLTPVLFASYEPAVGPVNLSPWLPSPDGFVATKDGPVHVDDGGRGLDWVIVGGESGPKRRPCEVRWIADLVEQCRAAGVPCFVKQDSHLKPGQQGRIPDDLWGIKEFPGPRGALAGT